MRTLYQKDSKGKIREFRVTVYSYIDTKIENDIEINYQRAFVTKVYGILGGKMQKKTTEVFSKNKGKKNYTSPANQASNEAHAIWQKKKDAGYKTLRDLGIYKSDNPESWMMLLDGYLSTTKVDGEGRIKPMLLYEARTESFPEGVTRKNAKRKDVKYPCLVDRKIDGVCTIAIPGNVLSTRGGKDRLTPKGQRWDDIVPQVVSELIFLWKKLKEAGLKAYTFHGEMYKHGLTLQEIQKANKKANPNSKLMELYIFDIVDENLDQVQRKDILRKYHELALAWNLKHVKFVESDTAYDEEDILRLEKYWLKHKYEGLVIRNLRGMYKIGGRSKDVLKMVRMDESVYEVIGIEPLDKEPSMGKFICEAHNKTFFITPGKGYNHADRKDLINNPQKYIGTRIPVTHRGYTDDGLPRIATSPKISKK